MLVFQLYNPPFLLGHQRTFSENQSRKAFFFYRISWCWAIEDPGSLMRQQLASFVGNKSIFFLISSEQKASKDDWSPIAHPPTRPKKHFSPTHHHWVGCFASWIWKLTVRTREEDRRHTNIDRVIKARKCTIMIIAKESIGAYASITPRGWWTKANVMTTNRIDNRCSRKVE